MSNDKLRSIVTKTDERLKVVEKDYIRPVRPENLEKRLGTEIDKSERPEDCNLLGMNSTRAKDNDESSYSFDNPFSGMFSGFGWSTDEPDIGSSNRDVFKGVRDSFSAAAAAMTPSAETQASMKNTLACGMNDAKKLKDMHKKANMLLAVDPSLVEAYRNGGSTKALELLRQRVYRKLSANGDLIRKKKGLGGLLNACGPSGNPADTAALLEALLGSGLNDHLCLNITDMFLEAMRILSKRPWGKFTAGHILGAVNADLIGLKNEPNAASKAQVYSKLKKSVEETNTTALKNSTDPVAYADEYGESDKYLSYVDNQSMVKGYIGMLSTDKDVKDIKDGTLTSVMVLESFDGIDDKWYLEDRVTVDSEMQINYSSIIPCRTIRQDYESAMISTIPVSTDDGNGRKELYVDDMLGDRDWSNSDPYTLSTKVEVNRNIHMAVLSGTYGDVVTPVTYSNETLLACA